MNKGIMTDMFSGGWAMEQAALIRFQQAIESLPAAGDVYAIEVDKPAPKLRVEYGVAIIAISGVLMQEVPRWLSFWGIKATAYGDIIFQVAEAVADPKVESIRLDVNSPGGQVAGVALAAEAIKAARLVKPVVANADGLTASSAYWLASQATGIKAVDQNTLVGSIGVLSVYYDWSKYEEKLGIRPVVIRSGEHKGMGIDKITDSQIAAVQEIVDGQADNLIAAVATGRGMSEESVRELATGQLWIAAAAVENKLIDAITNQRAASSSSAAREQSKGVNTMKTDEENKTENKVDREAIAEQTKAAERQRLTDIKSACAGDVEFAMDAWERGLSATEAKAEFADVLLKRLDVETAKNKAAAAADNGAEPLRRAKTGVDTAAGDFMSVSRARARQDNTTVTVAMLAVAREQPELHAEFKETQQESGQRRFVGHK